MAKNGSFASLGFGSACSACECAVCGLPKDLLTVLNIFMVFVIALQFKIFCAGVKKN